MTTTSTTPTSTSTTTTAATPDRPSWLRRALWRVSAIATLAVIGLAAVAAPSASADVPIAGVTIQTSIDCAGSFMLVASNTSADVQAYSMAYLYDGGTGTWIHEPQWHAVSSVSMFRVADFTFAQTGYVYIYMYYAVWTTSGWQMSGEYITGSDAGMPSGATCVLGY